ncbi:hypothetical protein KGP36_02480 [Patescibacteria group bacterium]|nr:hypothetical protein [Patescibacteria group bacterium]
MTKTWKSLATPKEREELEHPDWPKGQRTKRVGWRMVNGHIQIKVPEFLAAEREQLLKSRQANLELYHEALDQLHALQHTMLWAKNHPFKFLWCVITKKPIPTPIKRQNQSHA